MQFGSVQYIQETNRNFIPLYSYLASWCHYSLTNDRPLKQNRSLEGTVEEILWHHEIISHMKINRSCRSKL